MLRLRARRRTRETQGATGGRWPMARDGPAVEMGAVTQDQSGSPTRAIAFVSSDTDNGQ